MKGTPIKDVIDGLLNHKKENSDNMMEYKPTDIMVENTHINEYDFPMIHRDEFPLFSKEETDKK